MHLKRLIPSALRSIYAKILFGGAVGFCAVIGGMYAGNALTNSELSWFSDKSQPPEKQTRRKLADFEINLAVGDLFPLEDFTDINGQTGNFEDLLFGKKTLALFVTNSCNPCLDLLQFYQARMRSELLPGVQVVACMPQAEAGTPMKYEGMLNGITVVYCDYQHWGKMYNLLSWPAIVGVDNSGFVTHVQPYFAEYFDYQLVEYFFQSDQLSEE